MTTGRINQVTTLRTTGPAGPRSHPNSGTTTPPTTPDRPPK